LRPILDPYNPEGSSRHVDFTTTKQTLLRTRPDRCHVNFVVLDSDWEAKFAETVEQMPEVRAYVKNHGLHFEVPYVLAGDDRRYRPDFILRIDDGRGPADPLNLIVEIKGFRGEDAAMKADTMKRLWVPAVNNAARFGRWEFLEIRQLWDTEQVIRKYLAKVKAAA
jgi:type III restriction enzyme